MDTETLTPSRYMTLPVDQIQPSKHQARKDFDEDAIKSLAGTARGQVTLENGMLGGIAPGDRVDVATSGSPMVLNALVLKAIK